MEQVFTLKQILQVLEEHVEKQSSGTLFVHSTCNHAITFALKKGRIFAIFHGARRGLKAIPLIGDIAGGSYKFESSELSDISHELPPSEEILDRLRQLESGLSVNEAPHHPNVSEGNKEKLCLELKGLLGEYLGPIAEMVFEDTLDEVGDFCASPSLTQDLVYKLSKDIDNPDEVTRFRKRAQTLITRSLNQ